ncbi:MAG: error-prone DNA polymerase [Pseudomonadota bacterium]
MRFVELVAASNFSFLKGASHPEEMVVAAAAAGYGGLALCDHNTLAGVVRGHLAAKDVGLRTVVGARLAFVDGTPEIVVWPHDRAAYGRLCRLLTTGNLRGEKGDCRLKLSDLEAWGEGLLAAIIPGDCPDEVALAAERLRPVCRGPLRLVLTIQYGPQEARRLATYVQLAKTLGLKPMASLQPLYHGPDRRPLQDVLTAIREHTTVDEAGTRLALNAERVIKPIGELARLYRVYHEALEETGRVFDDIVFSLDDLRYEYPEEPTDPGRTPQETLERLTAEGVARRYPGGPPKPVADAIAHELSLIGKLEYAPYFLTVYDVVRFANERGILAQGRGSAANSAVCYVLGITEVDPARGDLLFERFISPERREPPDIDVDFEHERREEVIQYIYEKYGRERAGIAATVITYRARSAAREVGKALGLSEDAVSALSGTVWGWGTHGVGAQDAQRAGLNPEDHRIELLVRLTHEIGGFPRHLSQHVGGFVITRGRLDELAPVVKAAMDDRTNIEWDKDDLDALGILKIDVLALGMLTCLRKGLRLLEAHYADHFRNVPKTLDGSLTLASIPSEESDVYDMICRADTLGVFQIESRAQMTMLPRLRPRTYYDLVIEVAIVRPGPIQGDMVHPYLRRRQGKEPVSYPSEELKAVLSKTMGVPLFQEQAMRIAIVAAGFTPSEADQLRRAMATFKKVGTIGTFQDKMIEGMKAKGYDPDFAERCFKQIEGFGEYGFPESHAASFALLVYSSCWLKCRYPDVFCAALLNSQPMGFYAPAQIVRDARLHGVDVRPVDVNASAWDCTLEPGPRAADGLHRDHQEMADAVRAHHAVRLGFRQVKGLSEVEMHTLTTARGAGYDTVRDLWLRTGLKRATIERLADADAFGSLGLSRRDALWAARGLEKQGRAEDLPLFAAADWAALQVEAAANLPPMPPGEEVINDYRFLSLSLKAHPASFVRPQLETEAVVLAETLAERAKRRSVVSVAGLVLVRQRPGSAKGVIFMTLEDETGIANVIVWPKIFEAHRSIVLGARFVKVTGRLQAEDNVIHLVASTLEDRTHLLTDLGEDDWDVLDRADEVKRPAVDLRTVVKPRSRLARLMEDAPELKGDVTALLETNGAVVASLDAHRAAARAIAGGPPLAPAPSATWGTARSAANDLAKLGTRRKGARRALPKGRNFH